MAIFFGEKIKSARKNSNLTQKELGDIVGVSNTVISNWEKDINKPDPDSIELLCGALNVSPNYLLSYNEKNPPTEQVAPQGAKVVHTRDRDSDIYYLLCKLGFINDGDDITSDQLEILTSVFKILEITFMGPASKTNVRNSDVNAGAG